ncbi:MAG TPA: alpha/beta hydrolase [Ktedonobacterales bacterium]
MSGEQVITAREDTLGLGGTSIHYATWGAMTSPDRVAMMVHGLTATHREFAALGPQLAARGWYVIAPDLRGRGLSAKPKRGYNAGVHAADLLALCDRLGVERVTLIGHSLGAVISMYTAALFPARVAKLVLIDAGGKVPDDAAQAIAASVNRLGTPFPSLDAYLAAMSSLPVFTWNPFWEQYFRYDADVQPDGTVVSRVPKAAIEEEMAALFFTKTELLPEHVKAPTLLARAERGTLAPDKGFVIAPEEAERVAALMPDCKLVVIPESNHYTIVISPTFVDALTNFLG